ncbi:MAG: cupin domain-containing protein [Acetobacteraceae bacterium]|nr:cupin domain-containing protein [Acetobacteraceae bacterium]
MHEQHNARKIQVNTSGRRDTVVAGAGLIIASLVPTTSPAAQTASGEITVTPAGARPVTQGSAEFFTGSTRIQPLFSANAPARTSGGSVTFEPGARAAWHTHPLGQVLIVTAGSGWVQLWGSPKQPIRQGDVVWIPPGLKHWHGATATTSMTHTALQEQLDGRAVDWMEHVTDEQYRS